MKKIRQAVVFLWHPVQACCRSVASSDKLMVLGNVWRREGDSLPGNKKATVDFESDLQDVMLNISICYTERSLQKFATIITVCNAFPQKSRTRIVPRASIGRGIACRTYRLFPTTR